MTTHMLRFSKTGASRTDVTHWHSGNPQRSSWGLPTMSATIQLSETESKIWEHKVEVRVEGWGQNVDRGNQEYQVKKDKRNIWGSYESPWERMRSRLMTQVGQRPMWNIQKLAKPWEEEVRLPKDMESQGTNHDITPPSKVQCPNAWCWLRVRSLWVSAVEFGDELLGALYIMGRVPLVSFNTITLPVY